MLSTGFTGRLDPEMKSASWSAKTSTSPIVIVVRRPPSTNHDRILTGRGTRSASTTIVISVGQNIDANASRTISTQLGTTHHPDDGAGGRVQRVPPAAGGNSIDARSASRGAAGFLINPRGGRCGAEEAEGSMVSSPAASATVTTPREMTPR